MTRFHFVLFFFVILNFLHLYLQSKMLGLFHSPDTSVQQNDE